METFICDNCGKEFPIRRMKEAVHEEGNLRVLERFCPSCLDKRMNASSKVRGIVGTQKSAAVHLDRGGTEAARISLGERKNETRQGSDSSA